MSNLSTKELNYIKDYLSWELYMAKLCNQYATQMSDQNFGGIMNDAGHTHQQNFNDIYHYLDKL